MNAIVFRTSCEPTVHENNFPVNHPADYIEGDWLYFMECWYKLGYIDNPNWARKETQFAKLTWLRMEEFKVPPEYIAWSLLL